MVNLVAIGIAGLAGSAILFRIRHGAWTVEGAAMVAVRRRIQEGII